MVTVGLCVLCILNIRWRHIDKQMNVVSFFGVALFFFGLLIVKDFLDMCWIRTVISEHVFKMDLKHYVFDQQKLKQIKQDIMEVRKLQVKHGIEVDPKDPLVHVLFDDKYSEENLKQLQLASPDRLSGRSSSLDLPRLTIEMQ